MRQFGRRINHDPRNRAYGIVASPLVAPKTVLWESHAPVLDQGETGMCTAVALCQWLNVHRSLADVADWMTVENAEDIYSAATRIDPFDGEYPPDDTGSDGISVCKVATERGLIRAYRHAFGLQQTLVALQDGPVLIGTTWFEAMNTPDASGFLPVAGQDLGGHEYLLVGADMEHKFVTIQNSWSGQWGENGRARITFSGVEDLLAQQGDVTVPLA